MTDKNDPITVDKALIQDVRGIIEESRALVADAVNTGLTMLYWRIGLRIRQEILEEGRVPYGDVIVSTLSRQFSWSHFREIIYRKDALQREFCAQMCRV